MASEEKYGPLCLSLSQNILGNHEDAEECVNDAWRRAWDTIPPQRPNSLRAYLAKIVRNLSIDRWRTQTAQKRGGGMELLLTELEDCVAAPSAEEQSESREITRCIDRWLDELPSADRAAFVRRYWYGRRVDELAREAGCSARAMTQRLYRLRCALREELEKEGITL